MLDSELRRLLAPVMAHCVVAAAVWGLLLPPTLFWLARGPLVRFFAGRWKLKVAGEATPGSARQFVARAQLIALIGGTLAFQLFFYLLKWFNHARSTFDFSRMGHTCTSTYLLAFGLSFAGSFWWIGGVRALRPPGYDPKNPNPDPDEWRWQNRT
jgi:hypothetical protein